MGGGSETTEVVGGAHARAEALARVLAGNPEAERLALILLVARGLSGLWVQRRWRAEGMQALLREAAEIAEVPEDSFTLAVSLYTLCDPTLLELPPALAIEAQLGLLRALGGLEDVSLWTKGSAGRLGCEVHVGPREPSRRAAAVARETLEGHEQDRAGTQQLFGVPVMRWQRPYGALVARVPRADRDRGLVLLDQAAAMIGPMLERLSLLERSADRERSLVDASERRLTRLGFDLHDQPLQEVAALASEMRLFRTQIGRAEVQDDLREILLGRVQDLEARLAALDGSLRALCHSLEPPTLVGRPLEESLRQEVDAHAARTETAVTLDVRGDLGLPSDSQRIALVRILQECLSNAREHSGASEVRVALDSKPSHVELTVTDNGRGFDVESTLLGSARRGRLGLVGVHERARLLGGTCEVTSRPGGPTAIAVSLPRWEGPPAAADAEARAS